MTTTHEETTRDAGPVQQAQEKVGAGVEQVKSTAGGYVREQVDQRSTQLGEQLHGAVQALRQAGQTMEQEGTPGKQLVDRAAQQAERTARYLSQSDGNRLLNDLEGFGRKNPWAVIAGGMVLGFVGARFLKASSSRRFEDYRSDYYRRYQPQQRALPAQTPPQQREYSGSA